MAPETTAVVRKRPDDFAAALRTGRTLDAPFAVFDARKKQGARGPFVQLTLGDRTGAVDGKFWPTSEKECDEALARLEKGTVVRVVAVVETFNGRLQVAVRPPLSNVTPLPRGSYAEEDFRRASPIAMEELERGFAEVRASLKDRHLAALWDAAFAEPERRARFFRATAAKGNHHAYAGGLAEHTLEVVRIAAAAAQHVPGASRDLCAVGALFHDIGKMEEYAENGFAYDVTDDGRFVGHMVFGVRLIDELVRGIEDFPSEHHRRLVNIVLSHHGEMKLGWGSAKDPECAEAHVVHHADMISSRTNALRFRESGWGNP